MKRVALLVPSLSKADAVGNDVVAEFHALRSQGIDVNIFAEYSHGADRIPQPPEGLLSFLDGASDATLIYHLSIGWDKGKELFRKASGRRIIRYHNVTPPHFFAPFSKQYEAVCEAGRKEVARLKELPCHRYWGDSAYNCAELQEHGIPAAQCDVLAPFHQVSHLESAKADEDVLRALDDGKTNILMVGRIAPNKGHAAALAAFATYFHNYDCRARLILVGAEIPGLTAYSQMLRRRVWELGLAEAVAFAGTVSIEALKSYYARAHLLLVTSQHEGFCVPLVEAMSMKVPIVALDTTAIGETLDGSGVAWPKFDSRLFAEAFHRLACDQHARRAVGLAGWHRYRKCFSNEVLSRRFLEVFRYAA